MKLKLLTILILISLVLPTAVFAQTTTTTTTGTTTTTISNQIDPSTLPGSSLTTDELIPTFIGFLLTLIAIVAFVSLLYSGFMYISSGGDTAKAEQARKNIVWALTGIIVAVVAYVVVRTVTGIFN